MNIPESNLCEVVETLVGAADDLYGAGLVEFFRVLLQRAEERKNLMDHSTRISMAMLQGKERVTQELVDSQVMDVLYEANYLKLFVATACQRLAERLFEDLEAKQERFRKTKSITFSPRGEVDAFPFADP